MATMEYLDTFGEMCETALENYKKMGEACLTAGKQLQKQQMEMMSSMLDMARATASKSAQSKDYPSFVASQAEMGQECLRQMMRTSQDCAAVLAETSQVYQDMLESCVKAANSNLDASSSASSKKGRKAA